MAILEVVTKEMYAKIMFSSYEHIPIYLYKKFQIAVDEIYLIDGECPPTTTCDFETSFCGWINDTTGNFYWTRSQKSTLSIGTGPTTGDIILPKK